MISAPALEPTLVTAALRHLGVRPTTLRAATAPVLRKLRRDVRSDVILRVGIPRRIALDCSPVKDPLLIYLYFITSIVSESSSPDQGSVASPIPRILLCGELL